MPLFTTRPPVAQLIGLVVAPAVFGAVTGVILGVSAGGYWGLQILGVLGGLAAGYEHPDGSSGADRGMIGGAIFGSFVLLAHAIAGTDAKADLGEWPGVLVAFTTIAGGLLGWVGGSLRARSERQQQQAA